MPNFGILLHRIAPGGPIRVTATIDGDSAQPCLVTDDQLRERFALVPVSPSEVETIFSNLSSGRGEHRAHFPSKHWPQGWETREQFFDFWSASGQSR